MQRQVFLEICAKTNTGKVRNLNEDSFILTNNTIRSNWFVPRSLYKNELSTLVAIADGMGGANAGEVASNIAVQSIKEYFKSIIQIPCSDNGICSVLKECVLFAHKKILDHASSNKETDGMGTTLIVTLFIGRTIYVAWVGDSRCYYYKQERGLSQLSKDHSIVQHLIDNKKITKEGGFHHPQSNIILQSLGDKEAEPKPDITVKTIKSGDTFLLCSDGLNSMLTDTEIEKIIDKSHNDIDKCVGTLIGEANRAGGLDNITVALIKVFASNGGSKDGHDLSKATIHNGLRNPEKKQEEKRL